MEAVGDRVLALKRLFNIREGWVPADDWLPQRLLAQPLCDGPRGGTGISADELGAMTRGYYQARGYDARGFVPAWMVNRMELGCQSGSVQFADVRGAAPPVAW